MGADVVQSGAVVCFHAVCGVSGTLCPPGSRRKELVEEYMGLVVLAGRGAMVGVEDSSDNYCRVACAGILG